jgi:ammonium transporter, Amt family
MAAEAPLSIEDRLKALEAAPAGVNSGDTAWMLVSSALVLFMTIPGLALFYGGLVRSKNVLSVLMQCFVITAVISVLWIAFGYSLAFDTTGMVKGEVNLNSFVGTLAKSFLAGVTSSSMTMTIPETVFCMFQLTFAIITPALIVGAFAERMKFSAMLIFSILWSTIVYLPIAHAVWSGDGGYFWDMGVLDFAGGTVVHINAGIAALVAALMIGKRAGYPNSPMKPHNLVISAIGAGMLWVGWFGFNAGSAVAANGTAGMAFLVTHVATAAAVLAWMFAEWIKHGKPSLLGAISGAVAGLVAITPAAGFVGPVGAIAIGGIAGICCFLSVVVIKGKLGYDDSLDAFGVHGVGGIVGALLTGVFAAAALGGMKDAEAMPSIAAQLWIQAKGCLGTIVYTGVVSFVLLKIIDVTVGLRVSTADEQDGLDVSQHGEEAYNAA